MKKEEAMSSPIMLVIVIIATVIIAAVVATFMFLPMGKAVDQKNVKVTIDYVEIIPGSIMYSQGYKVFFTNGDRITLRKDGNADALIGGRLSEVRLDKLLLNDYSYQMIYDRSASNGQWVLIEIKEVDK